jgi:hypothetical protein
VKRLIQPGWILFQIAVVGFFLWVAATVETSEPRQYGVMLVAGIFTAYALTVAILILNEGRKDVMRLVGRRRNTTAVGRGAAADQRLGSPQSPDRRGRPGSTDRRDY